MKKTETVRIPLAILTILGMLALIVFVMTGTAQGADVCPEEGKVESQVDGDLDDIVLDAGTLVCIKAGQDLVEVVADGESTLAELIDNGHNVSHYTVLDETTTTTTVEVTTTQSDEEPTTTTLPDETTTTTMEDTTTTTVEDTTTTTVEDTTTTTVEDTTTTTVEDTTTTTEEETTTTTVPEETTTTQPEETTTTVPEETTTSTVVITTSTAPELPFTGANIGMLVLAASALVGLGVTAVSAARSRTE